MTKSKNRAVAANGTELKGYLTAKEITDALPEVTSQMVWVAAVFGGCDIQPDPARPRCNLYASTVLDVLGDPERLQAAKLAWYRSAVRPASPSPPTITSHADSSWLDRVKAAVPKGWRVIAETTWVDGHTVVKSVAITQGGGEG